MDKFAENIKNILEACIPYAWLLPVVGLFVIGICLAIPTEGTRNFAKKGWWGVLLGTILVMGAIYFGEWYTGKITF